VFCPSSSQVSRITLPALHATPTTHYPLGTKPDWAASPMLSRSRTTPAATSNVDGKQVSPTEVSGTNTGNGSLHLLILNLGTVWRWLVSFTPGRFIPEKCPPYPPTRKLGENHSQSGSFGIQQNLLKLWVLPSILQLTAGASKSDRPQQRSRTKRFPREVNPDRL
jgi:hypothetical protein